MRLSAKPSSQETIARKPKFIVRDVGTYHTPSNVGL
jgi:hypothetical protein